MRGEFMNDAFSSFVIGLLCTGSLFATCFLLVVGFKAILYAVKERLIKPPKAPPEPEVKSIKRVQTKHKRKPKPVPKPVRSIEIDPEQVDRIYVKKIS
jgi:hypothetical protein